MAESLFIYNKYNNSAKEKKRMNLYHGSDRLFKKPDLTKCKEGKDFGKGFYLTSDPDQARKWAVRFGHGFVYTYTVDDEQLLDTDNYKILIFSDYSREWLDFICTCRLDFYEPDADIIYDRMADNTFKNLSKVLRTYYNGDISANSALAQVKWNITERDQYCFKTKQALSLLERTNKEEVWR